MKRSKFQFVIGIAILALASWLPTAWSTQGNVPTFSSLTPWNDGSANPSTLVMRDASGNDIAAIRTATGGIADQGYFSRPVSTVTGSTYSMTGSEGNLLCNATSNTITVSLPLASTASGRDFYIVKTDSSGNAVSVARSGSDTINGSSGAISLGSQWSDGSFVADGVSNWIKK
jgi:hypothetical protein